MRFGNWYGASHGLCCGIDYAEAIVAIDRDQKQAIVWRERNAVRRLADFDRLYDFVSSCIDDVDR